MSSAVRVGMAVLVLAGLAAGGCAPPKGESTGRVDVTNTTKAERESRQVMPVALQEQADVVAGQLAADLSRVPEFNRGYRVTVIFGDINNKTGIVPTSDFEAFRAQVRQNLMQSDVARRHIKWVENRSRWEQLRRQEGSGGTGARDLNEEYTYFLNGDMYRVARGEGSGADVNLYSMGYNLTKMSDAEIIWSSPKYQIKQVR